MTRKQSRPAVLAFVPLLLLAACGERETAGRAPPGGVQIEFEDVEVPAAFSREGTAARSDDAEPGGLWGIVPDLPRPESAVIRNLSNGRTVTVALFRARGGLDGHVILLSQAAANELGIADQPEEVRITAIRSEPKIVKP